MQVIEQKQGNGYFEKKKFFWIEVKIVPSNLIFILSIRTCKQI